MRALVAIVVMMVAAMTAVAHAQQSPTPDPPCTLCPAGNQRLDQLEQVGATLRANTSVIGDAERIRIDSRNLSHDQGQQLDSWRSRMSPELRQAIEQVAELGDEALLEIAYALCNAQHVECATFLRGAMRCTPEGACMVHEQIPFEAERGCDPYVVKVRSPKTGFGVEYATGWQRSKHPVDHRAWSLGLELRRRLDPKFGLVARLDRSTGRDESRDVDGDGRDDVSTGQVTRITALAGPTLVFAPMARGEPAPRYIQVDSLVGYVSSSQADESGVVVGLDVSYQFVAARIGLRALQGFGDASEASSIVGHVGIQWGAGPQGSYGAGCGHDERPRGKPIAIALDIPLSGWSNGLGYIPPGFGIEGALYLYRRFDAIVRADLLVFPGGDRERVIHQSLFAGGRIDLSPTQPGGMRTGFFMTLLAGYAFAARPEPGPYASGPVADASLGWGPQAGDGAASVRLHGRFGITPDNWDVRAVFLSGALEFRAERAVWNRRY